MRVMAEGCGRARTRARARTHTHTHTHTHTQVSADDECWQEITRLANEIEVAALDEEFPY